MPVLCNCFGAIPDLASALCPESSPPPLAMLHRRLVEISQCACHDIYRVFSLSLSLSLSLQARDSVEWKPILQEVLPWEALGRPQCGPSSSSTIHPFYDTIRYDTIQYNTMGLYPLTMHYIGVEGYAMVCHALSIYDRTGTARPEASDRHPIIRLSPLGAAIPHGCCAPLSRALRLEQ